MKNFKIFPKKSPLPNESDLKTKRNTDSKPTNELIDSRFGIAENDALAKKRVPNSWLFQMYSQENDALFI